ncbi:hypothetical protein BDQ12DRAFT_673123 [Crucibulum laeve]|uniref:Uncharacterized protein n=1 Tax=Crucibulum laeve TaxID=68775 RepID=A0A5C3MH07_9AGAR|nr:hypothetical protein BDQ12DRAFT_673123 [Crucibulum laeve]
MINLSPLNWSSLRSSHTVCTLYIGSPRLLPEISQQWQLSASSSPWVPFESFFPRRSPSIPCTGHFWYHMPRPGPSYAHIRQSSGSFRFPLPEVLPQRLQQRLQLPLFSILSLRSDGPPQSKPRFHGRGILISLSPVQVRPRPRSPYCQSKSCIQ